MIGRACTIAVVALALGACSDSGGAPRAATSPSVTPSTTAATTTVGPPDTTRATLSRTYAAEAFVGADAALEQRVTNAGLGGGFLRIVADDGTVIHEHATGSVSGTTPLEIASSTKWLTAATFMTFVDEHAIALDDDIARWLPEFAGSSPPITPRMLMDHTSGVHDNACQN